MLFVCKSHVKYGLKNFSRPHVQKVAVRRKCKFCSQSADFQLGLFLEIQRYGDKGINHYSYKEKV